MSHAELTEPAATHDRPATSHAGPRGTASIHRLPLELMVLIFRYCLAMSNRIDALVPLELVCHAWYRVASEDAVWDYVARRYFVAFPLVAGLCGSSPTEATPKRIASPAATNNESFGSLPLAFRPHGDGMRRRAILKPLPNGRPTKLSVSEGIRAVTSHNRFADLKRRVEEARRYLLHFLLSVALLCTFGFLSAVAGTLELHPPDVAAVGSMTRYGEPCGQQLTSRRCANLGDDAVALFRELLLEADPDDGHMRPARCLLAVADAFQRGGTAVAFFTESNSFVYLHLVVIAIVLNVTINVVLTAHFEEEHALLERVRVHLRTTILPAALVCTGLLLTVSLPAYCLQSRWTTARYAPWLQCLSPTLGFFALWQLLVVALELSRLRQSRRWEAMAAGGRGFASRMTNVLWTLGHLSPTAIAGAIVCFVRFLELAVLNDHGEATWLVGLLWAACVPLAACLLLLSVVFFITFLRAGTAVDGVGSLCLLLAALSPAWAAITPLIDCSAGGSSTPLPKGRCLVPLCLAAFGFWLTHFVKLLRLMRSVDELDVRTG